MPYRIPLAFLLTIVTASWAGAADHEVSLTPRDFFPGDSYALFLRTDSTTEAHLRSTPVRSHWDMVELRYSAAVIVTEVDDEGIPTRERHEGAQLTYVRPYETEALFDEKVSLDIHRLSRGRVEIYHAGERVAGKIERTIEKVLAQQFEYGLGPELFTPSQPVAVGDTWALDPWVARRFLRQLGVRAIRVSKDATATLVRSHREGAVGELAIRYSIPIPWFAPERMPAYSLPADSNGLLEGEIVLPPHPALGHIGHSSMLTLSAHGSLRVTAPGGGKAWLVQSAIEADQRTRMVKKRLGSARIKVSAIAAP